MEDAGGCPADDATAADGGYWEAEARALGIAVEEVAGLTRPELVVVRGCEPVILLAPWRRGPSREEAITWALCELHRRTLGPCAARRQIGRAVGALVGAGAGYAAE